MKEWLRDRDSKVKCDLEIAFPAGVAPQPFLVVAPIPYCIVSESRSGQVATWMCMDMDGLFLFLPR